MKIARDDRRLLTGVQVGARARRIRQDWRADEELLGGFSDEELVAVWSGWFVTRPDCEEPATFPGWLRESRGG